MSADRRRQEQEALRELHASVPDDARQWCECLELTADGRAARGDPASGRCPAGRSDCHGHSRQTCDRARSARFSHESHRQTRHVSGADDSTLGDHGPRARPRRQRPDSSALLRTRPFGPSRSSTTSSSIDFQCVLATSSESVSARASMHVEQRLILTPRFPERADAQFQVEARRRERPAPERRSQFAPLIRQGHAGTLSSSPARRRILACASWSAAASRAASHAVHRVADGNASRRRSEMSPPHSTHCP